MVQVSSSETSIDVELAAVRVKSSENDPPEGHGANVAVAGGICAAYPLVAARLYRAIVGSVTDEFSSVISINVSFANTGTVAEPTKRGGSQVSVCDVAVSV